MGCQDLAAYDVGDVAKSSLLILKFLVQINRYAAIFSLSIFSVRLLTVLPHWSHLSLMLSILRVASSSTKDIQGGMEGFKLGANEWLSQSVVCDLVFQFCM